MRLQVEKLARHGGQGLRVQPDFEQVGDDVIIASARWTDAEDGGRDGRYQVITFREGKIVDLQGCASRGEAERFARRRAASAA